MLSSMIVDTPVIDQADADVTASLWSLSVSPANHSSSPINDDQTGSLQSKKATNKGKAASKSLKALSHWKRTR